MLVHALEELGLVSLYQSPADVKLLFAQRFLRLFAYGSSTLVLVTYLEALDIGKTEIGLFMTLTLAGDVVISFILTTFADAAGRKATLALGAILMMASGIVFAMFKNYWVLLGAAVLGVITPSGNEIGPFRAVEDSIVAHLTTSLTRGDIYAWFTLVAKTGTALGLLSCGWAISIMTNRMHWELTDAYRAMFIMYASVGAVKLILALSLSNAVESDQKVSSRRAGPSKSLGNGRVVDETAPLLANGVNSGEEVAVEEAPVGIRAFLPKISKESMLIMFNLCLLFALNAFSSSLVPASWVTYFFRSKFDIEEGTLGTIFFATNLCSAASIIVASSLAKRFGNVNIMVFTHLPSSIFMGLIGLPNDVALALVLLFLRDSTKSMNVAPRSAFLAAIVLPNERTAVIGLVNVVKTLAQTIGPTITGVLAERQLLWVAFLCSGAGKVAYDVGLLVMFKNHERDAAERERIETERRRENAEAATDEP
ncbi:MFS general substrate transporter [Thozetella sp. PMI_491]|nr:MFS general substrate transporter [Thozetella sp. PMI_491]